jgi:hypothetical protein
LTYHSSSIWNNRCARLNSISLHINLFVKLTFQIEQKKSHHTVFSWWQHIGLNILHERVKYTWNTLQSLKNLILKDVCIVLKINTHIYRWIVFIEMPKVMIVVYPLPSNTRRFLLSDSTNIHISTWREGYQYNQAEMQKSPFAVSLSFLNQKKKEYTED